MFPKCFHFGGKFTVSCLEIESSYRLRVTSTGHTGVEAEGAGDGLQERAALVAAHDSGDYNDQHDYYGRSAGHDRELDSCGSQSKVE